jgi:hypothetical protein
VKHLYVLACRKNVSVAQQLCQFDPRFCRLTEIFPFPLRLSDAQLAIAREAGFASSARLDLKDVFWRATAAEWAHQEGKTEVEAYLHAQEVSTQRAGGK